MDGKNKNIVAHGLKIVKYLKEILL